MKGRPARGKKPTYCGYSKTAKIRYKTLADAKSARRGVLAIGVNDYIRIYKCPKCKGYHLTHMTTTDPGGTGTVWRDPKEKR